MANDEPHHRTTFGFRRHLHGVAGSHLTRNQARPRRDLGNRPRLPGLYKDGLALVYFSRILGPKGKGPDCDEGQKFSDFTKWLLDIEKKLGQKLRILIENVIPQDTSHAKRMADQLEASFVVADASDYKLINRPRLWWTRIKWTRDARRNDTNISLRQPWSPFDIKVGNFNGFDKIWLPVQPDDTRDIEVAGGGFLPTAVKTRKRSLACLTTPADEPDGRPMPP